MVRWGGIWFMLGLVAVIVASGYLSVALTRSACLDNAAIWYGQVLCGQQSFHLRPEGSAAEMGAALERTGIIFEWWNEQTPPDTYPQVTVRVISLLPFVLSAHFERRTTAEVRIGFTAYYLCLFGIPFSVGDSFDIPPNHEP